MAIFKFDTDPDAGRKIGGRMKRLRLLKEQAEKAVWEETLEQARELAKTYGWDRLCIWPDGRIDIKEAREVG